MSYSLSKKQEEEIEVHEERVYEVLQDRVIHSHLSPVLPHFPRVPTRIVGQVMFNT